MGFLSRIFGRKNEPENETQPQERKDYDYGFQAAGEGFEFGKAPATWEEVYGRGPAAAGERSTAPPDPAGEHLSDEQALRRYRYMLATAAPEMIEQAHAEAFARLTPAQRAQVLQELARTLPDYERNVIDLHQDDPKTLARVATRAEMRQPGMLERTFGSRNDGSLAGTLLASIAGGFVGSMVAHQFFSGFAPTDDPGATADIVDDQTAPVDFESDMGGFDVDLGGDFDL